jgi:hypothetical protein
MKRTMLTVMVLAISVIFVAAVMAAEQKAPAPGTPTTPKFEKFKGVVEKVDEVKKDILVKSDKEEMTFSLTDKTKFTEGKKELTFADLKSGLSVTVKYKKEGDKLIAFRVSVHKPKTMGMKEKAPSEKNY